MKYPGHPLNSGAHDRRAVIELQRRLNTLGCGPLERDGVLGSKTKNAVRLYQARYIDAHGLPLKIDGIVGPITWASLFGSDSLPAISDPDSPLIAKTLTIANSEVGVMEDPIGSNRGPKVDQYLSSVGLDPTTGSYAWCAAFVYWCFAKAARRLDITNPVIRTAGVLNHWNKAREKGIKCLTQAEVIDNITLLQAGMIFIISTGGGNGHEGFVLDYDGGKLITIEGNTNVDGSTDGIGVFRRTGRKLGDINKGFIDYSIS